MARSVKRRTPRRPDPSKVGRGLGAPVPSPIDIGTVGYLDDQTELPATTPAYVRWEQGEPIVEVTARDGDRINARVGCWPLTVRFGQQVVLAMVDGDPANAVIVGVLADSQNAVPSSVCGIPTGAAAATSKGVRPPAATWTFLRLEDGEHFAVQTQQGGDINIHAGSSVHIRCDPKIGAVHIEGATHLGVGPLAPPVGSTTGPAGVDIRGVPAIPYVPTPYAPPAPAPPAPVPYVGFEDGIVRAKDAFQITVLSDPEFIAWMTTINGLAMNPDPAPVAVTAYISGVNGPGSKHTAVGEPEPA
ncbi:MAG TPA: hypothetical protein VM869_35740 [Enhygromyxa sp.]|nr:hypothetical protein [Enhygromyxa sp.]